MNFICEKKELLKAINTVAKSVAVKSVLPILECILIETKENCVTLKGSDTTLSIQASFQAAIRETGKAAVPARLFQEIVNKYPEGEISIYQDESGAVQLKSGSSKATLQSLDPEEFPEFPNISKETAISISEATFRSMINQTVFSTAITEDKPILTGVLFELEDHTLNVVALDGYRLALRKENISYDKEKFSVVIPSKSLKECSRILDDTDEEITVYLDQKAVLIEKDSIKIYTRILEGDYVKYKSILPNEYQTRVRVEIDELLNAIERASILSREENNNLIKFEIREDTIAITANSEIGKAFEEIPAIIEGKELLIAFNARYMTDVLKNIEDVEVLLDFNTNISPCVLKPEEGDSYLYLVLPVQIRS